MKWLAFVIATSPEVNGLIDLQFAVVVAAIDIYITLDIDSVLYIDIYITLDIDSVLYIDIYI